MNRKICLYTFFLITTLLLLLGANYSFDENVENISKTVDQDSREADSRVQNNAVYEETLSNSAEEIGSAIKKFESSKRWYEKFPNGVEGIGAVRDEEGGLAFLNTSQKVLSKALKFDEDIELIKGLIQDPATTKEISQYYLNLPGKFHMVEEASRVKMVNFLTAGLELFTGSAVEPVKQVILDIITVNVADDLQLGQAQSIAGDKIRLLAALHKYQKGAYDKLIETKSFLPKKNQKILDYFMRQMETTDET